MNSMVTQHQYPPARAENDRQWLPGTVANLVGTLNYG